MLQRNFPVWSGAAAIALAAVACTDSTTPHGTPARPSFWGGGGTPACFRVTGGGRIDKPEPSTPYPQSKNPDRDFATFGFQARPTACNSSDGSGEIEWVDHSRNAPGQGFTFHGTVSSFSALVDHYHPDRQCGSFSGTGRAKAHDHSFDQTVSFTVDHACDEGEPGKGRDHIRIILSDLGYDRGGILTGGNIQQHRLKGGGGGGGGTGDLRVTNTTTGSNLDPDGYTVTVDNTTSQPMATNGSTTFTALAAGDHSVALSGVAANCSVAEANPQTVMVPAGGTASTTFTISCTAPPTTGNLTVSTTTTGSNFPSSYTVTVDPGTVGETSKPITPNGSVTFTDLAAGSHSVALTVASNCTVTSANPQSVSVPAGGTATTSFTVSCAGATVAELAGNGAIGPGTPTTGSEYQTFVFDVKADLTGTLKYTDYNLVRNGSPTTVDVGPGFPGTGITAYRNSSTACSDPTKGAEFDGILQVEGETNQYTFTVAACDNGPSGSGLDFFSINVPNAGYSKAGFLVSGDIVKTSP